jgi:hypothetical protein
MEEGARMEDREVGWEVPVRMLPVQTSQKERHFRENEHDRRHKYDQTLSQDNDN